MPKVRISLSMSLDGFVAGPQVSAQHAMGVGGERLHYWLFNRNASGGELSPNETDVAVAKSSFATTGAVILGRRTFDVGLQHWEDTPYPAPSFVLTHRPHETMVMTSSTFTFVTDGLESALRQAKAAAGDRDIMLMGADISRQYLKAGLVDEVQITLVPVLFGAGSRLFEQIGTQPIELESEQVLASREVTHLTYRVVK